MTQKHVRIPVMLAVTLVAALLSGCVLLRRTGPVQTKSETVELGDAESVAVNLRMGGGELSVEGGADALMAADFTYNVADWEPMVEYDVSGGRGELSVEQPDVRGGLQLDEYEYVWDLTFANDVPMDLTAQLGAGRSTLNVADLSLTSFSFEAGAGDTTVDLDGDWEEELDVSMRGGVGQATIYLPADVSTRVTVDGGIGELETAGLSRDGDAYVNDAYQGGDATLDVDIEGGVGRINLEVRE
jgi:hypothetical protein